MLTVFKHALRRSRGQIIGWGLALFLLGVYLVPFFDTFAGQQEQFMQLLSSFPKELMAFFGDMTTMFTPTGYLTIEFFSYMPLIIGVFAVVSGSGLLAADEENGTLDLVLAHPVSRTSIFVGRFAAFVLALVGILFIGWLGLVLPLASSESLNIGAGQVAQPFLSLLAVLLVFGTLALALSMVLPSRKLAASAAGLLLVANFFVNGLARLSRDLKPIDDVLPFHFYQSGDAINGLNVGWFAGLLAVAALFTVAAWWRFQRRDIRVAGEGGWRLSLRRQIALVETRSGR